MLKTKEKDQEAQEEDNDWFEPIGPVSEHQLESNDRNYKITLPEGALNAKENDRLVVLLALLQTDGA